MKKRELLELAFDECSTAQNIDQLFTWKGYLEE